MKSKIIATIAVLACIGAASAQTTFNGGEFITAGNWSSGFPSSTNPGTVAVDGVATVPIEIVGAIITQTAGTIDNSSGRIMVKNAIYTMDGGTLDTSSDPMDIWGGDSTDITVNNGASFLAAGNVNLYQSGKLTVNSGGILTVGGTLYVDSKNAVYTAGELNLLGGTITAGELASQSNDRLKVNIGGDAEITTVSAPSVSSGAYVNFSSTWTGSFSVEVHVGSDWETELTGGGWYYEGTEIDAAAFASLFVVTGGTNLSVIFVPPNNDPVFTDDPIVKDDGTYNVAYTGTIAGSATDVDGDTLSYTNTSGGWLTVASDGSLTGIPDTIGTNEFTVMVDDGKFGTDSALLKIYIPMIGSAPEFTTNEFSVADGTYNVVYAGTIAGSATDVDVGDTLTYTNMSGGWLSIGSDGTLSGTPDDIYTNTFTVVVDDGNGNTDTATLNIYIPSPSPTDDTIFAGGNLTDAANWSYDLPGVLYNIGTIAVDGTVTAGEEYQTTATINQTAGTISFGTSFFFKNSTYTMDGGVIDAPAGFSFWGTTTDINVNNGASVTSGGSLSLRQNVVVTVNSGGTLTAGGGNLILNGWSGHGVLHLLGGTITADALQASNANIPVQIDGDATILTTGAPVAAAGHINIHPTWLGSFTVDAFVAPSEWEAVLTGGGWYYDETLIDATVFANEFAVSADGKTLSRKIPLDRVTLSISGPVSAGTEMELSWVGIAGVTYVVQTNSNLIIAGWQDYTSIPSVLGTNTLTVPITEDQTFYQVLTTE